MDVNPAESWTVEKALRQNLTEGCNNKHICVERCDLFPKFAGARLFRLQNRDVLSEFACGALHGRFVKLQSSAGRPIGLCDDGHDAMLERFEEGL